VRAHRCHGAEHVRPCSKGNDRARVPSSETTASPDRARVRLT
jgi:hypothetical protein